MCTPQGDDENVVLTQFEQEALLTEYREMREEIRANTSIMHQRVSRGIAAIGFVIGYSCFEAKAHGFSRGMKPTAGETLNIEPSVGCDAESGVRIRTPRGGK